MARAYQNRSGQASWKRAGISKLNMALHSVHIIQILFFNSLYLYPYCPPIFRFPLLLGSIGGFTMSDEGGFEELPEFFFKSAIVSLRVSFSRFRLAFSVLRIIISLKHF